MSSDRQDIILLSTADWDNPFWTNKQHVAAELAELNHKVLYIDSLGLRQPGINKSDIYRILLRLIKGMRFPKKVRKNLWIWSPIVIPFQKYFLVRIINKTILYLLSSAYASMLGMRNPLLWTYNPMTLDLFAVKAKTRAIYHCVDEIKEQPGMPAREIEAAEYRLLKRADYVFVTSNKLYETRKQLNHKTFFLPNVADYEHFSKARDEKTIIPEEMLSLREPVIGFVGAISGYKVDFNLIEYIAINCPHWSIVLIGKVGEGEPGTKLEQLEKQQNIVFLGPKKYADLPAYIKAFDVAIIPSALNGYTHAMFPMKFFEYLAAGKQIVSTNIDALQAYSSVAYLAKNYDDFIQGIKTVLSSNPGNIDERIALASANTYKERTIKMLEIIQNESGE